MRDSGMLQVEIAAHFGCTRQSILALFRRHDASGSVDDRHRSGSPRVTTQRQDRMILLSHLRDRWIPATRTARGIVGSHGRTIISSTVRRRLASQSLRARRPFAGPILSQKNRIRRQDWVQHHIRWTYGQWGRVLFSFLCIRRRWTTKRRRMRGER